MTQEINNQESVGQQVIVGTLHGNVISNDRNTRFSKRFKMLCDEVLNNSRYEGIMEDFEYYNTKLDGVDMPTKLKDGGYGEKDIIAATRRKEKYSKKLEKHKFFQSALWIDSQLFAKIKINFETYVEPLINGNSPKEEIACVIVEKVIKPILQLINIEGEDDEILNYDAEDIYGMIYFLTGKCHINWTNYDNI